MDQLQTTILQQITAACIASLNATINTNNNRKINAENFFRGMFETCLKKGELMNPLILKFHKNQITKN